MQSLFSFYTELITNITFVFSIYVMHQVSYLPGSSTILGAGF